MRRCKILKLLKKTYIYWDSREDSSWYANAIQNRLDNNSANISLIDNSAIRYDLFVLFFIFTLVIIASARLSEIKTAKITRETRWYDTRAGPY